ncbi:related to 3-phytase A precursor [Melanopsichium pennsylvanicum]|uniref:Related to 3-phytase A n=2 Tax=Melanopsichium pennsylvanicum TaxID=63383 RepID=A0AAJ5C5R4_9BASI|nr:related to 3-phytase A precursor [Melanopsichium pennsylvanicum 4]SNX84838.1 related to 3-phytase A precursor [Melanopsichium pennsylvanicum]
MGPRKPALLALASTLGYGTSLWPNLQNGQPVDPYVLTNFGSWSFYVPGGDIGRYGIHNVMFPGCEVEQVNQLMRHDYRGASKSVSKGIANVISKLVNASSYEKADWYFKIGDGERHPELDFLSKLEDNYQAVTPELLTSYGEQDAHASGYRFQKDYGHLLGGKDWYNDPVNKSLPVFIRTTDQERVNVTSWAFSEGFMGLDWRKRLAAPLLTLPDSLSTFNTSLAVGTCPYSEQDSSSDNAFAAWNDIWLPKVVQRLQNALPNLNLTSSDVQALQNACPFQSAYLGHLSPFCAIFTLKEWQLYSYGQDLQQFFNSGYGGPLGRAWSVGWVNEMLARLTDTPVRDQTSTNSTIDADPNTFPLNLPVYLDFTHDTQIASALSVMGLLKDNLDPTTPPKEDRNWNAAHIAPMGARMVVERLNCKNKPHKYVRVILNDAVVPLSGLNRCSIRNQGRLHAEAGLCKVDDFVASQSFAQSGGNWTNCYLS